MRKSRSLIVGILCGIACMAGVLLYVHDARASLDAERAEALSRYGTVQVEAYVATRDIAAGSKVDQSSVERKTMPGELLPEGAVTDLSQIEGHPAQAAVYRGEVLVAKRFEEVAGTSIQVPDGMCAVSVPAKAVSAVGGSVSPGADVNVYSTTAASTDLLVANVQVLSTSASVASQSSSKADVSWITLAVEPDVVSDLIAAAGASELYFTLPSEKLSASEVGSLSKSRASSGSAAADSAKADATKPEAADGASHAQPDSATPGQSDAAQPNDDDKKGA